jgi:hypothetical protein
LALAAPATVGLYHIETLLNDGMVLGSGKKKAHSPSRLGYVGSVSGEHRKIISYGDPNGKARSTLF